MNYRELYLPYIQRLTALMLWEREAIRIDLREPFQLASGNFSPIYINCRQMISDPLFMRLFSGFAAGMCRWKGIEADMIAGGETAGIPFAAYAASDLGLPMLYVRKRSKGYGLASQLEGGSVAGQTVLLIEDLITDAGSKLGFIEALRSAGGTVNDVLVLFDRQQGGETALRQLNIRLHSLTNLSLALQVGRETDVITAPEHQQTEHYLADPRSWHRERGLEFKE